MPIFVRLSTPRKESPIKEFEYTLGQPELKSFLQTYFQYQEGAILLGYNPEEYEIITKVDVKIQIFPKTKEENLVD